MATASFEFAGRVVRIDGPESVVGLAEEVLAHHRASPASTAPAAVLTCAITTSADHPELSGPAGRRSWTVPSHILDDGPNWFFYHGFGSVLQQVWADLGLIGLHGGLLVTRENDGILVIGDRHDGKSSVAAGWLDEGAQLAGDDTALLDVHAEPPQASGFLRELHLDRALEPVLRQFDGIADAEPYLPRRPRVRFDWITRFPEQVVSQPVVLTAVIRTRVDRESVTCAVRRNPAGNWDVVRGAVQQAGSHADLALARRLFERLPVWEVVWGYDVWAMPGKHLGYISGFLGTAA